MSAWAQAAWIVDQINDRFDFSEMVADYLDRIYDDVDQIQSCYEEVISQQEINIINSSDLSGTTPTIIGAVYLIKH